MWSGRSDQLVLNGTHESKEFVLARMTQLMDQSRSVLLLLRSAKAQEFGELWRVVGPFHLNWHEQVLFGNQNGQMESDLRYVSSPDSSFLLIFSWYEGMRVERPAGPSSKAELTTRHVNKQFSFALENVVRFVP